MTEEEYHRIARREKIFYAVLIIAWCFAFAVWFTIGFPKAKWVLIGGGTLIYLYLKSTFTGLPWSRRLVKPHPVRMEAQEEIADRGRLSSYFGNGKKRVYDAGRTLSGGRNAEEAGIFFWRH